ncbi:MAG: hypothetical protein WAP37_01655, partial [Solirubrobacterales bacterium]
MTGGAGQRDPIRIGRVGRPHGVRGGFYVDGAIDPDALRSNLAIVIAGAAYTVASRAGADAHPILTLTGLDERDRAAALRGQVITAERDALTPLATGEWYASDLEGMHVVSVDGATLGIVGK